MIEKNIFQSWYTTKLPSLVQNKIDFIKESNPEYKYHLYTDNDIDMFVNENFPGEIANAYNKLNIIVAKVDFWRYLVLYKYGGVYLDMDSSIERPLKELINDDDQAIITAEGNPGLFVQWGLIFSKEHPILKKTIELVVQNINTNRYPNNIIKMTGPGVFSEAINEVYIKLFGNSINHSEININTNKTEKKDDISFRVYGLDYNQFFKYKHEYSHLLYIGRNHWRVMEKEIQLLKYK